MIQVGQGRGGHVYLGDELGQLAGFVIARVHPNNSDRELIEDCWQTAYAAGLQARSSADRAHHAISKSIVIKAMRTAVFRLLRHRTRKVLRESDLQLCA